MMKPVLLACMASLLGHAASAYPVTVENRGRTLIFDHAPEHAVVQDINMSQMMFALQTQPNIAGIIGVSGWYKTTPDFDAARGAIPELAPKYGSLETLIAAKADFFLAGWYYGMTPDGPVTPDTLARVAIPTYVLTESCAHIDKPRVKASMELLYTDELALGAIFGKAAQAKTLVVEWQARLARVANAVADEPRPRVFLYDSGEDKPFTAGRFAMPTALIDAAGGRNVLDDIPMS
jgi:iron complex transport system substrate-binding protein